MSNQFNISKGLLSQAKHLMSEKNWMGCIKLLESKIEMETFTWELYWNFGWSYFKTEDFIRAADEFKNALAIVPKDKKSRAICVYYLGLALQKSGMIDDAKNLFEQALELRDSGQVRMSLAICHMELGNFEKAELLHTEGLNIMPNNPKRLNNYAAFLEDTGRMEEANTIYKRLKENKTDA